MTGAAEMLERGMHHIALRIFGFGIGSLMICCGVLFLWAPGNLRMIPPEQRMLFGAVIILYGAYRIVSTYWKSRNASGTPF